MLSEVPEGWEVSRLADVAQINIGGTPSRSNEAFWDKTGKGEAWVSIADLKQRIVKSTKETITTLGVEKSNVKFVPAGTILMSFKLTVGRVALAGRDLYTNEAIAAFALNDGVVRDYLYHYLPTFVDMVETEQAVKGKTLNKKSLAEIPVFLPPLNEQHRIAEILSSVDASIQATHAVIEQAERVKSGLMEELLTGGLGKEAIELGEVPDGWKSSSIGALTELQNGYGFKSKDWAQDGLPIIRIQNLNGGGDFNYFNGKYDEKYLVQKGDLLFCWSGSRGTSFGARYWTQEKGLLNQHIFKCLPKDGVEKAFLYYLLDWMTVAIEKEAHGGAGLAHIKKSEMVAFSCCIPPVSEQRRIAEVLFDFDDFVARQKSIVEQQNLSKRGLMDDLLTGKVRAVL